MQVIILWGGLATRLGDATKSVPKMLLDIAGRTVLERLAYARQHFRNGDSQ